MPKPPDTSPQPIFHWREEEIPRYPPFMKGLPVVPPDKLLAAQAELLERIANTAMATATAFDRFYQPPIMRFAAFSHLLPASQSHHHRGAGGLLRHSLEVGLWALQSANKLLLDAARSPAKRRELEPRWQLAVFLAALCHDAGKPATDLTVTNRERTSVWKPIKEDLYTWARRNGIDAYYLDWREGRSRQHTAMSHLMADRIIGSEALEWIEEGDTELLVWLMESLNGNPGPTNPIHNLVVRSDQTSVERDLKTLGVAMAGYDLGVPVERHLTDIMRRLVREGLWRVNEPGARLWNLDGHLYLIWPAAGEEIARQVREDGIPGIPRTPDGILDMLVERRIAFVREGTAPGDRFWKIAPACLLEKIPDIRLSAIRLRDEAMVSSVPVPVAAGGVVEDVGGGRHPGRTQIESGTALPAKAGPVLIAPPVGERRTSHLAGKSETLPERILTLDGSVGEALKSICQDLQTGEKEWGADALLDEKGHILMRWPDTFAGLELTPKAILDELGRREWLWTDPLAPLKKVQEREVDGRLVKLIRLEWAISQRLISETDLSPRDEKGQGKRRAVLDSKERKNPAAGNPKSTNAPALDEILEVIRNLPAEPIESGFRQISKLEVMGACKAQGIKLTHGGLAKLGQQDTSRLVVEGFMVRFRY